MADGFCWYELITNDMDKAVAFYEKVVGWEIRDSGMPGVRYLLFGKSGKDVGGMMTWSGAGAPESEPVWMGHIYAPKLDEELKAVTADGGTILKPAQDIPGVGRFAVVKDPQGAEHMLFEPGSMPPAPRMEQNEVGGVGWHELVTADAEKALEYYGKHYGWEPDRVMDMGAMGKYYTFRMDRPLYSGGMMSMPKDAAMQRGLKAGWMFYLTVDSVDDAAKRVTDAGGKVTLPPMDVPGGARVLQGMDDQGGRFALVSNP